MSTSSAPLLEVRDVKFGYRDRPSVLDGISFSVEPGQLWTIVGPNGAGKSTLLRLMAALLRAQSGEVLYRGRPLYALSARERARRIAFLPQRVPLAGDLSAREVVLMGRYPHRTMGLFESAHDLDIAERAMVRTEVSQFADRLAGTLSGGEAQRVHLAAVLAQEPELLLLDEPTASLDIKHQLAVFEILRAVCMPDGPAVIVVTHDVNLVTMYGSHVLLLHRGRLVAAGPPLEVLTPTRLREVYEVELVTLRGDGGVRLLAPKPDVRVPQP